MANVKGQEKFWCRGKKKQTKRKPLEKPEVINF